jgi:hypothetical protein
MDQAVPDLLVDWAFGFLIGAGFAQFFRGFCSFLAFAFSGWFFLLKFGYGYC